MYLPHATRIVHMTDLYLIAHKVRSEPAFDIACQMECPECHGGHDMYDGIYACTECDSLGYWWIIPTSGHRAYPYDSIAFNSMREASTDILLTKYPFQAMPDSLPDHYHHTSSPATIRAARGHL